MHSEFNHNNDNNKNDSLSLLEKSNNSLLEALENNNFISFYLHFTSFSIYQEICMPEMDKEKQGLHRIVWFYLFSDNLNDTHHQQLFLNLSRIEFLSPRTLLLIAFCQNREHTLQALMDKSVYIDFENYERFMKWIGQNLMKKEIIFEHPNMTQAREHFFHQQLKHQLRGIF